MGNPDLSPPDHVVEKLAEAAGRPDAHGYSQSKGIRGLRTAQAGYYARRFGVDLDPDCEILVTLGSKEGLHSYAEAITGPGDTILVPDPCYPIHALAFTMAGATVRRIGSTPDDRYFAALEAATRSSRSRPKVLLVNYPSNPTGERATLEFYERLVQFAREFGLYLLSDLAYAELYFDGEPTPSILQAKGACDVAVELTTLSKTYSMAGWRVGFAAGSPKLIAAMTMLKSYKDYGSFGPIQAAASAALSGPQECVERTRQIYRQRRDVLVDSFGSAGWEIPAPQASMFAWAPLPPALRRMGSVEFSRQLLSDADIAVTAGAHFGARGEGYVRLALVENEQRIRQAAANLRRFLRTRAVNVPGKNSRALQA